MTQKINDDLLCLNELTTQNLTENRSSVKWSGITADTIPMFIAEMDFCIDPKIQKALQDQIARSDLGYATDLSGLVSAFAGFTKERWNWEPRQDRFYGAPDVSFGVKAALKHFVPKGGRVILTTPVYPSFFGYLKELEFECIEIPLIEIDGQMRMDVAAIAASFSAADDEKAHALILSNPHNPHGTTHTPEELEQLAKAAKASGALVVSDEIHAPLVHDSKRFTPFAPIAAAHGATSVIVTSASKGWNVAGTKCALVYAPEEIAPDSFREHMNTALSHSVSILGRTANETAFRECGSWLDAAIDQVRENSLTLKTLLDEHLPAAKYTPPEASYLAWIDLREAGLGDNPAETIEAKAKVIVSDGSRFGENGKGFIRLNMGCAPELLQEAVKRIAAAAAK